MGIRALLVALLVVAPSILTTVQANAGSNLIDR
jgi:hypothetical protein